ncbi:ubiquitin carboxyl-terminal hydrolase 40 isoform X1, partial [Acipenser oxyrinchus oxyrinchus]
LTLPGLPDLWVPSPGLLRVWVLESKRPCSALLLSPVCSPRLQELLLYLQVGVPGQRQYYPAEELVWDTSRGSSSRALCQAVTSHYSLPPDKTLIAMYCPDKSHWMPISSWVSVIGTSLSGCSLYPLRSETQAGFKSFYPLEWKKQPVSSYKMRNKQPNLLIETPFQKIRVIYSKSKRL